MTNPKFESDIEVSQHVTIICALMRALEIDAVLTYATILSALQTNRSLPQIRGWIYKARKIIEKEEGYLLSTVAKIGIKRDAIELTPAILHKGAKKATGAIKRAVRRATIHAPNLRGEPKRETDASIAGYGAIAVSLAQTSRKLRKNHPPSNMLGPTMPE